MTFQEFYNYAFEKMYDADQLEALQLAFSAFDPDDQRVIPSDRLKKWLMTLGNPLTDKEAKELIELGDPANRGFVVYDDLVGVLLAE